MAGKDSHIKHHECMNTFFRIIGCGDLQQVATQKAKSAARPQAPGDWVAGRLRFKRHEHNGQVYQDIECYELVKLNA